MLVDLSADCLTSLQAAGYNATPGTFGIPYTTDASNNLAPLPLESANLPNYEEQEIVVINAAPPNKEGHRIGPPADGISTWWQDCSEGFIDPRPVMMSQLVKPFELILRHGGIFIILLSTETNRSYVKGPVRYRELVPEERGKFSNDRFLDVTQRLGLRNSNGAEISVCENTLLTRLLSTAKRSMHFECVIDVPQWMSRSWTTLAVNKYGEIVSGIVKGEHGGTVLLLPQIDEFDKILPLVLSEWASEVAPALFPHIENRSWKNRTPYELPEVTALSAAIETVRASADIEVAKKEREIAETRSANSDYYTLLTGTGRELVLAVVRTLRQLGFSNVVDVDAEAAKGGLREDVQICDRSPTLIVDIKGVSGHPSDDECQQAEKHAIMRLREWDRTDVRALTIINSQKHLPPLERDLTAFRNEMIENAKMLQSGLMTTVDLAIILRSARQNGWKAEAILPILYRTGRILPHPVNYEKLGIVVAVWKVAVGIVSVAKLKRGDRIAAQVDLEFVEFVVDSIQVNSLSVEEIDVGAECGIGCSDAKRLKKGLELFVIR